MASEFNARAQTLAEVIVRVGLNLQPGQPLLVTDPYDLQGIHPDSLPLAEAVRAASATETSIQRADLDELRALASAGDLAGFDALVARHTRLLRQHLERGGAFLFLTGSAPQLRRGLSLDLLDEFDRVKWRHFGPVIQQLIRGATQWTLAPAPTPDWAALAGCRVGDLWETLFAACRVDAANPLADWNIHLTALGWQRDQLNATRPRRVRYRGPGTELRMIVPRSHCWCTTQLTTRRGVRFVANLPTEEIFTAPHKNSAHGTLRVSRPVVYHGVAMTGIELDFQRGRVVAFRAENGQDALEHLLAVDAGASRIGEVAIVPGRERLPWARDPRHHILLDENATHHLALGDGYRFCSRAWLPLALNSSLIHVDLPLEAEAELS